MNIDTEDNYTRRISNFLDWAHRRLTEEMEEINKMEQECGSPEWFKDKKKPGRVAKSDEHKRSVCEEIHQLRHSGKSLIDALRTVGISSTTYRQWRTSIGMPLFRSNKKNSKPRPTTKPRDMKVLARDAHKLFQAGMTCEAVARKLKSSRNTIRKALKMQGLKMPSKNAPKFSVNDVLELSAQGLTTSKIGKRFNCSRQAVSDKLIKAGYKYSKETKQYNKTK
jgi:DNA-binding CsgD family transcriptional regulator